MKDLIRQIEGLKLGKESDYYNQGHDAAIRKVIEILQSHPAIHCKALRKKGTNLFYYKNQYNWHLSDYPDTYLSNMEIKDFQDDAIPEDAILVDLIILEQ